MRLRLQEPQPRDGERGYVAAGEIVYRAWLSDQALVEIKFAGLR